MTTGAACTERTKLIMLPSLLSPGVSSRCWQTASARATCA